MKFLWGNFVFQNKRKKDLSDNATIKKNNSSSAIK
jgi:hypothetical protein